MKQIEIDLNNKNDFIFIIYSSVVFRFDGSKVDADITIPSKRLGIVNQLALVWLIGVLSASQMCFADDSSYQSNQGITNIEHQNNDYSLAIARYSENIKHNPTDPVPHLERARIYLLESKLDAAIADCDQIIQYTNYPPAFDLRGEAYFELRDNDKAIADFNQVIRFNPDNMAYFSRGAAYMAKNDYTNSLADFNKAIHLDPKNPYPYISRGNVFTAIGNLDNAIADYSEVIRIKPDSYIYLIRGNTYTSIGNLDKAIADYSESIQLDNPKYAEAYANRGLLYSQEGDYVKGIADCSLAIQIDTNCAVAYNNIAWLLATAPDATLRNGKRALEYAEKACKLNSWKEPRNIGTLAAAYAEIGNFDEALKWQNNCMQFGLPQNEMNQAKLELDLYEHKKPYHERNK